MVWRCSLGCSVHCEEIRSDVSAVSVCSLSGVTFSVDGMGSS